MTGDDLRRTRRRAGLTQRELAELVGLHRNTLARLERGEWPISDWLTAKFWKVLMLAQYRRVKAHK